MAQLCPIAPSKWKMSREGKPTAFDVILVHSFNRFFRDQFQLEFYVRWLAKNGVRLVSITRSSATIR
jgi:DNA invertase Pin-like site-specific DNA recombinase